MDFPRCLWPYRAGRSAMTDADSDHLGARQQAAGATTMAVPDTGKETAPERGPSGQRTSHWRGLIFRLVDNLWLLRLPLPVFGLYRRLQPLLRPSRSVPPEISVARPSAASRESSQRRSDPSWRSLLHGPSACESAQPSQPSGIPRRSSSAGCRGHRGPVSSEDNQL
jgi:hypothetical protein